MRGLWGEGNGTLCMKLETCLQTETGSEHLRPKRSVDRKSEHQLLERQDVRPGDGVSVDEGEELLEDGEEGPVGEDADALLHLQAAAGDGPPVHDAEQPEPDALPLRQQLPGERLVELDRCSVNLRDTGVYWAVLVSWRTERRAETR